MLAIHLSNVNDNLTVFESLLTWEVMLNPVKIRLYALVLNLVMSELNGYKLRLERLSKKSEQIQPQDQRNNDRLLTKL